MTVNEFPWKASFDALVNTLMMDGVKQPTMMNIVDTIIMFGDDPKIDESIRAGTFALLVGAAINANKDNPAVVALIRDRVQQLRHATGAMLRRRLIRPDIEAVLVGGRGDPGAAGTPVSRVIRHLDGGDDAQKQRVDKAPNTPDRNPVEISDEVGRRDPVACHQA